MARQLDAIYEHGILRPLTPLHLAEHQHLRLTLEETNGPLSWTTPEPVSPCRAELEWLAKESREYAGQWVALDGSRLVAHGAKLASVRAAAEAAGVPQPFFASVPDDDLPFGGW